MGFNSDKTKFTKNGKVYNLFDAYPSNRGAKDAAKDYRSQIQYADGSMGLAIVEDMGKNWGRLRYGVFVRKK